MDTFLDHLTLSSHNSCSKPPNLENYHIFGILRTSAFRWAIGKAAGVNIVRSAATWIFLRTDTQKHKKILFFAFGQITRDFDTCSYIQGTTMWKLTSWGFQKCIIYRSGELPRRSYSPSKMKESEKNGPSPKISGVTKKRHGHHNENWVPKRSSTQDNPIC